MYDLPLGNLNFDVMRILDPPAPRKRSRSRPSKPPQRALRLSRDGPGRMEPGGVRAARELGPRRRALLGAGPPRRRDSDPRALLPLRHRVPGPAATAPGADRRLRALRSVPRRGA